MDRKRAYYEDVRLFSSRTVVVWSLVLLAALAALPFAVPTYTLHLINNVAVYVVIALGMNILVGYAGQISLGHAGFVAIGAYTTVLTASAWGLPFPLALAAAGFLAAAFGFVLGLPALRLEGPYLAIATLAFGLAVTQVIGRTAALGGRMGLAAPRPEAFGLVLDDARSVYALVAVVTVGAGLAARNLMKSRVGRAFRAIRDSDIAAETLGVNLAYYKTLSFAVSAFYAGLAGGLAAYVVGFVDPTQYTFIESILYLAMTVVGGLGAILGSVLGGIAVGVLLFERDILERIPLFGDGLSWLTETVMIGSVANVGWILIGLVMILVVVFEPLGLYGLWLRTKRYWSTWPF